MKIYLQRVSPIAGCVIMKVYIGKKNKFKKIGIIMAPNFYKRAKNSGRTGGKE
jgi:hypothetical protein